MRFILHILECPAHVLGRKGYKEVRLWLGPHLRFASDGHCATGASNSVARVGEIGVIDPLGACAQVLPGHI